ncbi:uncharacterized protein LOC123988135 [Osmia bicornis bicornis]|uniref:uncharacterized protein LOC123988135 n=1 Tax=Osmia bicornis bicornis TaxID=1437191 RepID=UPI001EAEFD03|nr:uncharacterized protein LOC123988135 [Osmia bicornis bicornis]
MDFTKAEILTLIEIYRSKSVLWGPTNCDYFNKLKKEDAWEELSREINKSKAACKKKVEYLLAGLRREKLKMKRSVGTGKGTQEVYKSQWFAFESMQFLWDKNKCKRTLSTMEDEVVIVSPEAVEGEVEEQLHIGQNSEMLEPGPSTSTPLRPTRTVAAKRRHTDKDDRLERAFQILESASDPPPDESQHFANFVAAKLRKLNNYDRLHIEARIMQLFLEIEPTCIDNI